MPKVGENYKGKVIKVMKKGALIKLPTNEVGFLHISEVSTEFVKNIFSVLKKDQEVTVRCIGMKRRQNKIFLSIARANEDVNQKIMFEAKMNRFLKDSVEKQKQIQKNKEKKQGIRRNITRKE